MTTLAGAASPVAARRPSPLARALLLSVGFAAAVTLRSAVGGSAVARSAPAGLVFAAALVVLGLAGSRVRVGRVRRTRAAGQVRNAVALGLIGAAVLCVPAALHTTTSGLAAVRPAGMFPAWAVLVAVVAVAEEGFLRGALYRSLEAFGTPVAILVPAVGFAALHLPLYGWGAIPLDFAVGIWLGVLRALSGTALTPAVAHTVADWAAWWLA